MGLSCWRYRIYDAFKSTWIASKLFYNGGKFQHLGPIVVIGTVADCAHFSSDGDDTFDLTLPGLRYHCELTVCQSKELHATVTALKPGQRVEVSGVHTHDPNHHILWKKFSGGHEEIHPVTEVKILS
jgi:hypothetical protein